MSDTTCADDSCSKLPWKRGGRGFCQRHYYQRLNDGTLPRARMPRGTRICSVEDCGRLHYTRNFCQAHYRMWKKHGDPLFKRWGTIEERFWAKVDKGGTAECWLWTGGLDTHMYGSFRMPDGTTQAHKVAYEWLVAPVPHGLALDHVCHNRDASCPGGKACLHRRCVNPAHLEPATNAVNVRRGTAERVTRCKWGHEFNEQNTTIRPDGGRACRQCQNDRNAAKVYVPKPPRVHHNSAKTHCLRGHEYTEANTRLQVKNGKAGRSCRACEKARAAGLVRAWDPSIAAA